MPRYAIAADTRSIAAMNGSVQGYDDSYKYIDAREASSLRLQNISSFQVERPPFYIREESITTSRRRMGQEISNFDAIFAAASRA